jgi:nucleoside-diphosphate-sugar epimerase
MAKCLLCIGYGFSARALTADLQQQGWHVIGTTRNEDRARIMREAGVQPIIWPSHDLDQALKDASHLLVSASPSSEGDPFLNAVDPKAYKFSWIGYLSTTGVYGDHNGGWVDETSSLNPATKRGQWRVDAETAWSNMGLPLHIFRLAGIYGPGRGPFSKVRNGTARRIIKDGQVFSRIHVDDISQVLQASINQPRPGAIYNVCDNEPAPPQHVIKYAAQILKLPVPPDIPFEAAELTSMARSFYAENKRVRNDLIKSELGVNLKYPNFKVGLQSLLDKKFAKKPSYTGE